MISGGTTGSLRERYRSCRDRLSLTPAGAGFAVLLFPGLPLAALVQHRLLLAISAGSGLIIAANAVMALRAIGQLSLRVEGPDLIEAGDRVDLKLVIAGDEGSTCEVQLRGTGRWTPATVPAEGPLAAQFPERSSIEELAFSVRTSYPLDLVALTRSMTVPLPAPIVVAPTSVATPLGTLPGSLGKPVLGVDDLGGLRLYQPGDSKRDVHWPTVARTGTLMVRERETNPGPGFAELHIAASRHAGVEPAIRRARSAGEQLLAAGYRLRLVPSPRSSSGVDSRGAGPIISSARELHRRLAEIDPADVSDGAVEAGFGPILRVDEEGARWQDCD